jgi:TonB family protein
MNVFFIYNVKAAIYLIAFYLVYASMLSRDTSYSRNRAYILLSLLAAFIFPFITLQTIKPWNIRIFGKILSEVLITGNINPNNTMNQGISLSGFLQTIFSIYIIVVSVYLVKLLIDLFNLIYLIIRHKNEGSRIIRFHGFNTSGFSAMGYTFVSSRLSAPDAEEIIRHEQTHLRQNHFIDIIFIEIVKAFQWFNPVVYLFNRSLRAIHEYQADQECISSGVPIVDYQSLLLNQVFKSGTFNLTNSFSNPSLIKKRMIMMSKKRTSALANAKILIVVPVVGLVFLAVSAYREIPGSTVNQTVPVLSNQVSSTESGSELMAPPPPPPPPPSESTDNTKVIQKEDPANEPGYTPFTVVEEMPMFPGGEIALLEYIKDNTRYPENAKEKNIQGKVIVRFCVTQYGGISMVKVLKGVSPELDAEAMRVVSSLPTFKPGKQGGKAVPVWYMVPIAFTLK